jgi:membrane protein implicated in regulation of membrane protease activity
MILVVFMIILGVTALAIGVLSEVTGIGGGLVLIIAGTASLIFGTFDYRNKKKKQKIKSNNKTR